MEIQAGLARTQYECLPMPPQTHWTWIEAYGFMDADPAVVHGSDWPAACAHVEAHIERSLRADWLEAELARREATLNRPPEEILHRGAGWGALESRRRARAGEPPGYPESLVFDDASLDEEQGPWIGLLEAGALPYRAPQCAPRSFLVQAAWRTLLEASLAKGHGDHWLSWLHVGIMRYHAGQIDAARQAWQHSLSLEPSGWALRNLAMVARDQAQRDRAADLWLDAHQLLPGLKPLAVECAEALLSAGRPRDVIHLMASISSSLRDHPRLQCLEARAQLETGHAERAEEFLLRNVEIPDIREGEVFLTDLWFDLHERRLAAAANSPVTDAIRQRVREQFPPPAQIDFRMSG
jgi:tetratricopeptide (TPR) repeat protein